VFERRSGTGRGLTENKKGGFGKNNWGVEGEVVEFTESETVHDAAEAKADQTADEIQEQPKVEEKKEMSYAEYQDQQAKIKEKLAHLAPPPPGGRQAGEGVDQSEWHQYTALSRPAAPEDAPQPKKKVEKKDAAAAPSTEKKKSKTTVKVVPVNEVLPVRPPEDPSRERRRANRGPRNDQQGQGQGGQGGQGQGSPRDRDGATRENAPPRKHNKKQPQLELSDQNAFPSLKTN